MQQHQLTSCKSILRCLVVLCLAWAWRAAAGESEYFSSIDSMQYLGVMEKELIQMYRQYLEMQRHDFALYRKFLEHAKAEHVLASEGVEDYLGNPINAFTLIKRAVVDWSHLNDLIANNSRRQLLNESMLKLHEEIPPPDYNEVRGAAKGVGRLQKLYNLNATDLAVGHINGFEYESKMSLRDCFEIGANLFELKEFRLAIDWLEVVLEMLHARRDEDNEESDTNSDEYGITKESENGRDENSEIAGETDEACYNGDNESCGVVTEEGEYVGEDLRMEIGVMSDAVEAPNQENQENVANPEFEPLFEGVEYIDIDTDEEGAVNTGFQQLFEGFDYGDANPDEEGAVNTGFQQMFEGADYTDNAECDVEQEFPPSGQVEEKTIGEGAQNEPEEPSEEYEAYEDYENEENPWNKTKILMHSLEYLALANYKLGLTDKAVAYLDELWEIDPEYEVKELPQLMLTKTVKPTMHFDSLDSLEQFSWYSNYTRLCQGIQAPDPSRHKLKCRLDTKNQPAFVLAPLKVEELNLDPPITVYHQLLSDTHIENLLMQAEEHMTRSQVKSGKESVTRDVRVSQQTWLHYNGDPSMQSVYRLVTDVTGLDLANAESMQVANYGIGGQYDPHSDYFGEFYDSPDWMGDRIATNLFYLSDVEQGGHTVFTNLNVYSAPAKGSMVSWFNLHKSLTPDQRTLHAGCPVIKGTKRIGNVWIHSGYQEFRRPCDLKDDSYKSIWL